MSKLSQIQDDLDSAKAYVRSASRKASDVKDGDGAKKCNDVEKKINDLKENFSKKGK